jgi:glucose-1-phosphate adenylyltransferase
MKRNDDVAAIMLAGGRGSRLHELTDGCCKPALPFGGMHRIADWTLANLEGAQLGPVVVATQYKPAALRAHLERRWSPRLGGRLVMVDGAQTGEPFAGTADAVRKTLDRVRAQGASTVLVVAADHVYRMDYTAMIDAHRAGGAPVTVAVDAVPRAGAQGFGIVEAGDGRRIAAFHEKPGDPPCMPGDEQRALASMGVYVFDLGWLEGALGRGGDDFGYDVLPEAVSRGEAAFHRARRPDGTPVYWQDVGTLDSYRAVWLALESDPTLCPGPFGANVIKPPLAGRRWIERGVVAMPGSRVHRDARISRAIVAPGVELDGSECIGEDWHEDARWFRITRAGTRLVTRAMVERRAESRARLYAVGLAGLRQFGKNSGRV